MKPFLILVCTAVFALSLNTPAFAGTYEEELNRLSADLGTSLDARHLKTVAVISFKDLDGNETKLGKLLVEDIAVDLVNQNKGVSVMDRANLNRIMEEKQLTEEGLVAPENAKQLKLSGIDAIIIGTIIPFEDTYRIDVKAIATDTAQLVVAKRASITKTDNLNTLMGIKPAEAPKALPLETTIPSPLAATELAVAKKQRIYDLGDAKVEITSVEFFKKTCKIRVNCIITNTSNVSYGCFAYHIVDKNAPVGGWSYTPPSYKSDLHLAGDASDNNGNTYNALLPADANSTPRVDSGQSVNARIEYQVDAEGTSIQLPETSTFSFEFYMNFQDQGHLHRLSVANYSFDKIH